MIKGLLKNKNLLIVILGIVFGVAMILLGDNKGQTDSLPSHDIISYSSSELDTYTERLENKISGFIDKIGGVSNVTVIVTIENSKENVYATEGSSYDYVILTDSSGNQSTVMLTEITATLRGIAVVCDFESEELKQQIISTLASLFNIGTNRVSVISAS